MQDKERPRPRLGDRAIELALTVCDSYEAITSAHLEEALQNQDAKIADLEAQLKAAKQVEPPVTKRVMERETDQLFYELSTLMKEQHEANLNAMNGLRYMLNVFGEDALGADVSELIKTTNDWLDQTIKPIAQTREENQKAREENERRPVQDGEQRDDQAAQELVNAPQEPQAELNLDQVQDRDDGREM